MTTISAKMICDSILREPGDPEFTDQDTRLSTLQLRYPRAIHAEFMTHRVFSRNASSSRAIPVKRLIDDVLNDPFIPLHWGKNQRGMQADEEHNAQVPFIDIGTNEKFTMSREEAWINHMNEAVRVAQAFDDAGYHKQIVNRLLEPFAHINVIVTSTEWSNFLALRDHPDAEPHIQLLAQAIRDELDYTTPINREDGEWHLPYVSSPEINAVAERYPSYNDEQITEALIRISVARCARVSYLTHDGRTPDIQEDMDLADRLLASRPRHFSPSEHQARPGQEGLSGNLHPAWTQFRKLLELEQVDAR